MKKDASRLFFVFWVAWLICQPALSWADTVYMQDGRVWKGIIVGENSRELRLDLGFDIAALEKDRMIRVERSGLKDASLIRHALDLKRQRYEKAISLRDGKPQEVPLVNQNGHVLVDALLEGRIKARLLLDTGSTITFLSADIAKQLDVPQNESRQTVEALTSDGRKQRMTLLTLQSVRIGNIETHDVQVAILPPTNGRMPYKDGLLGVSFLSRYNFKIDYRRSKLILEKNNASNPVLINTTSTYLHLIGEKKFS